MTRSIYVFVLAVAVSLASLSAVRPAIAAHHEAVTQVVIVEVAPGKLESYRQEVKKLTGVLSRLGSSAKPRMWQATAAGPNTGNVMVGLEYPNAAAWAADSAKIQRDAEWQRIVAGLDKLRTLVSSSIWRDISPNPGEASMAGTGILLVTGVQLKPGKLDTYLQRLQTGRAILERLGLKARMRVWHAELAGPETGSVAVGVEYPDLATYVADQAKLDADAEWKKLLSGLDDLRTLSGRSLFREITP